jgi:dTDP-4-amino-4,6-dideoxygalactose transaminase
MWKTIPLAVTPIDLEELLILADKISSNQALRGEDVEKFERNLASYLGVRKVFTFNTGRTALYVALQALGLKPGDEVVVPAYSCAIVFEVVLRLGLRPVFVDVDGQRYTISPELVRKAISPKTKAIVPIHIFGLSCDMEAIMEVAEEYGLRVVEDAAQALGGECRGRKIGSFEDLSIFSFGPGKVITGGIGGAIALNNPEFESKVVQNREILPQPGFSSLIQIAKNVLGLYAFSNSHLYPMVEGFVKGLVEQTDKRIVENILKLYKCRGFNPSLEKTVVLERMPNLAASILNHQLRKIDSIIRERRKNAGTIFGEITRRNIDCVSFPSQRRGLKDVYTRCVIRLNYPKNIDLMKRVFEKNGIDVRTPYRDLSTLFSSIGVAAPTSLYLAKFALALPNHPRLTESDVFRIVDTLEEAAKRLN